MIQRLDEEWDEVVPGRDGRGDDRGRGRGGDAVADLADGPIAIADRGGRWAASDGERVVAGDAADLAALAGELRGRPLIAHDVKGARRRRAPTACSPPRGPEGLDLAHDTMVAAYLIDPARRTYELHELAADAGLAAAPAGRRGRASSRSRPRRARPPAIRRSTRGWPASSPSASASGSTSSGSSGC